MRGSTRPKRPKRPSIPDLDALLQGRTLDEVSFSVLDEWFWAGVDRSAAEGCWPWTGSTNGKGYGIAFVVRRGGRSTSITAHRLAFFLTRRYFPIRPCMVTHACGNALCCRPSHLEDGDGQSNADDRERHGRTARGERSGSHLHPERRARGERAGLAKLTDAIVTEILRLCAQGHTYTAVAAQFGVSPSTVCQVATGQTWGHVAGPRQPRGGRKRGENHPNARISDAIVLEVHRLRREGLLLVEIAARLGISEVTVRRIVKGRIRQHVAPPSAPEDLRRGESSYLRCRPERATRGARSGTAKLTEDDVRSIWLLGQHGLSLSEIASHFGVSISTVSRILRREAWQDVTAPLAACMEKEEESAAS